MAVISGKAYWAKVYQPQASKFAPDDLRYSIDVGNLDKKNIGIAEELGLEIKTDQTVEGKPYSGQRGEYVTLRNYAKSRDGSDNPRPRVVDAQTNPMTKLIGNGSDVNVLFDVSPYKGGPRQGQNGFYLKGVQVVDLVEYEGAGDSGGGFSAVDGGYIEAPAPF